MVFSSSYAEIEESEYEKSFSLQQQEYLGKTDYIVRIMVAKLCVKIVNKVNGIRCCNFRTVIIYLWFVFFNFKWKPEIVLSWSKYYILTNFKLSCFENNWWVEFYEVKIIFTILGWSLSLTCWSDFNSVEDGNE